jgi:hypothetical protein
MPTTPSEFCAEEHCWVGPQQELSPCSAMR